MAPSAAELAILLRLRGSRQVQSEFKSTARAMKSVNPVVRQMGTHFGMTNRAIVGIDKRVKSFRRNVIGMGKTMLATAGVFAAWSGLKSMVSTTEEFARQTIRVTKATRLDAQEASRWVAIMKIRGIDATSFSRGLTIMSGKLRDATNGSKSTRQVFTQLGLNWRSLMSMPLEDRLFQITDALNAQTDAGTRLALGQKLFGRGFQKLNPILSKGSDGIREQLKLADKYGVTLHGKTVKSMQEFIEAQHENELAMLGMQITLSQALIPQITNITRGLNAFVLEMRDGTGRGGQLAGTLKDIWAAIKPISEHIARNLGTYSKFVAILWLMVKAYKAARAAAIAFGVAEVAATGPIGLAAAALVGIIALLYLFDRRTHFIRNNWKKLILLLPLVGTIAFVVVHAWKPVLDTFRAIVHAIKTAAHWSSKIKSPWDFAKKVGGFASHVPGIPHANGGMAAGPIKVGEFGPEIVNVPSGSHVTPASRSGSTQPIVVHVHSHIDGKEVAFATARVVGDSKARR